VRLGCRCWFGADKHAEILVTFDGGLLELLLERVQPARHQVHVLRAAQPVHCSTVRKFVDKHTRKLLGATRNMSPSSNFNGEGNMPQSAER